MSNMNLVVSDNSLFSSFQNEKLESKQNKNALKILATLDTVKLLLAEVEKGHAPLMLQLQEAVGAMEGSINTLEEKMKKENQKLWQALSQTEHEIALKLTKPLSLILSDIKQFNSLQNEKLKSKQNKNTLKILEKLNAEKRLLEQIEKSHAPLMLQLQEAVGVMESSTNTLEEDMKKEILKHLQTLNRVESNIALKLFKALKAVEMMKEFGSMFQTNNVFGDPMQATAQVLANTSL